MAYVTLERVSALVAVDPAAGSATLTPEEAAALAAMAEAEIDAWVARAGRTVPSPVPAAVGLAADLLAAARWEDRIYTGQDPNRSTRSEAWRREALGPAGTQEGGELGGILGAWLATLGGASGAVRYQTEWEDETGASAPWFKREQVS